MRRNPPAIDLRFLDQYPEHVAFWKKAKVDALRVEPPNVDVMTPQERMESGYQQMRDSLASELLAVIKNCPPAFFERLVVELLLAMGYGGSRREAGKAVGRSGDGGIDGTIKEDRLGLDTIYIQAKRWETAVGRPEVQKFAGALQGLKAYKGIMITTSGFSREAQDFAASIGTNIVLMTGDDLVSRMIDHNVGVALVTSYEVKRVDTDYFAGD